MLNIFEIEDLTKCYIEIQKSNLDLFCICGTSIQELTSNTVYLVSFVKRNLKCTDPVESIYDSLRYKSVCVHR